MADITTKRGDKGQTELMFGRAVSKSGVEIEALGTVDELNAALGLVRVVWEEGVSLARIQGELVGLMGELACRAQDRERYQKAGFQGLEEGALTLLAEEMRELEARRARGDWRQPGKNGQEVVARLHWARTVARRAERTVWALLEKEGGDSRRAGIYLNRLSDWLWLWADGLESASD